MNIFLINLLDTRTEGPLRPLYGRQEYFTNKFFKKITLNEIFKRIYLKEYI